MMTRFNVMTKATKRTPAWPTEYFVTISNENKTITIEKGNRETILNVGDLAEYDSYNLHYLGTILKITEKTVTMNEQYGTARIHRLSLHEFCRRNFDFDLERIKNENFETSHYI